MSGGQMFAEFISILSQAFSFLFVAKYLWLFIGIAAGLGAFVIKFIVRWFNA